VGVGDLANPFFVQTLQLLSQALETANLRLMLFPAHGSQGAEPSIQEVLHYRIDALVLLSVSLSSKLAEECRRAQVPIILYNRTTGQHDASCVVGDNTTGARSIAAHLLGGGHERLAFLAGTPKAPPMPSARRASTPIWPNAATLPHPRGGPFLLRGRDGRDPPPAGAPRPARRPLLRQ
jgi:DNA-binding LacI/PurR family transcriptional regulator